MEKKRKKIDMFCGIPNYPDCKEVNDKNNGTIRILGKANKELMCPVCQDDVSVNPKTGKCSICKKVFNIEETDIIVE